MTEPTLSGGGPDSASAPICPWCSATLVTGLEETCPSCGAALRETTESEVPGVTRVDVEAILKSRTPTPRGRSLMGWLSGEYETEAPTASHEGIAPPDEAVRREMLRLELAALEAEAQARQAELAAELAEAKETAGGPRLDKGATAAEDGPARSADEALSADAPAEVAAAAPARRSRKAKRS